MSSSIRSRSEWWRWSVLVLLLWGLTPLPAVGAELSEEARAQARVKFNEGTQAYEAGEFRKALAAFEAAYQLAPLPGFLFNVAQCHRQLGDYERAAASYRRYLSLSEKEPANAAMVKELIAEMDAKASQEAAAARTPETRAEPRRERSVQKDAERAAREIRTSRSMSASQKALPPAAVPAAPAPGQHESLTRKWWVWAGAGAAVLLAGGVVYAVTAPDSPRPTTLGTIPAR